MLCHICGCKLAESLNGRENHMRRYHAVFSPPTKRSTRTTHEIVAEVEQKLAPYIIDGSKKDCPVPCSCMTCFNSALDMLLASQEAENVSRTGTAVNNDVAGDIV